MYRQFKDYFSLIKGSKIALLHPTPHRAVFQVMNTRLPSSLLGEWYLPEGTAGELAGERLITLYAISCPLQEDETCMQTCMHGEFRGWLKCHSSEHIKARTHTHLNTYTHTHSRCQSRKVTGWSKCQLTLFT